MQSQPNASDDERTPLIATANGIANPDEGVRAEVEARDQAVSRADDDRPLPWFQLTLLCLARMIDPIAFFGIFPFINQMIQDNGSLPETDVGFYSGLIESIFSLTQMFVMVFWGRAADRLGRRPVVITSMIGATITTSLFGFSRTIWQMVLLRCLSGIFCGQVVTIRVMITELSTPKTQARAFSLFMFTSNLGIMLGPLIGGALADPAGQYGGVFKRIDFFTDYPYALSTLTTGLFALVATVLVALFVKDTSPTKKMPDAEGTHSHAEPSKSSTRWLLKQPGVAMTLFLFGHIMLLGFAYTAIFPLFWFTSIERGGFSLSPVQISLFLAVNGGAQAIWTLLIFPPLQHRFSTGWVLRSCTIGWLLLFPPFPLLNLLLRHATSHHVQWEITFFWIAVPILLAGGVGVSMAFTAIQLALNDVSPNHETLGVLNGLALSLTAGIRAFSPALLTAIFAEGVRKQILGGHLIWVVMTALALSLAIAVRWLPPNAEGRLEKNNSVE